MGLQSSGRDEQSDTIELNKQLLLHQFDLLAGGPPMTISPRRRQEIIDALRRGTVPHSSLDAFAVGLERLEPALEEELLSGQGRRGSLQGGSRRLRLRQDLLRPLAGRPSPQARLRHLPRCRSPRQRRRCTGWRRSTAVCANGWRRPTPPRGHCGT